MSKTIANLYKHAIFTDQLIISENKDNMLKLLEKYPVKTVKYLIKKYNLNQLVLELFCPNFFSKYESFVIVGCPHSTDVDVVCIVDNLLQSNGKTNILFSTELLRLNNEIYNELGYDKLKQLDINLISIKNNNITSLLKGGKETQNIILKTYHLHKQKYEMPNLDFVDVDILEKCRALAKFFLDNLEYISINYQLIRELKKDAYTNTEKMLNFFKIILNYVDLDNKNNTLKWKDVMKSIVVKFIQLILLKHNIHSYTKGDMINKICSIDLDLKPDELRWYLFRGFIGIENKLLFVNLHLQCIEILNEYLANINCVVNKEILFETINNFTYDKFIDFFNSPNKSTIEFEQIWNNDFGENTSVNSVFESESSNEQDKIFLLNLFDTKHHKNFIWINQRSVEWLELLNNFYKCGNNSKEIRSGFEGKFNLIRGAIAEILILDDLIKNEFTNFKKISLGLLVEDTLIGSKGCAPDLILVSDHEIIPVEIKCLKSSIKNSDYYDSINLAQKQCDTITHILNSFKFGYIKRKIIILSWFEINKLNYQCLEISY